MEKNQNRISILFTGENFVGKTSILIRLIDDIFYADDEDYSSGAITKREIEFDNKMYSLFFYDSAGCEKYRAMTAEMYAPANVVLLVYDVTSRESFEGLRTYWKNNLLKFKKSLKEIVTIVVGSKNDMEKVVSDKTAKEFAEENNFLFTTVSAKTKEGIQKLSNMIINQFLIKKNENLRIVVYKNKKTKPSCYN